MSKQLFIILILPLFIFLTACGNDAINTNTANINTSSSDEANFTSVDPGILKNTRTVEPDFFGEKGEKVVLQNGQVEIAASKIKANIATYFNVDMPSGNTVYFFVVQDKNGIYRAAANACQVCFKAHMGFRHEGDNMICNTCGNAYPLEKIATEKGGCNPGPINPNLQASNGQLVIALPDLAKVENLF